MRLALPEKHEGESLGPEGCDFEVDTRAFRVGVGGVAGRFHKSAERLPSLCLPNGYVRGS